MLFLDAVFSSYPQQAFVDVTNTLPSNTDWDNILHAARTAEGIMLSSSLKRSLHVACILWRKVESQQY